MSGELAALLFLLCVPATSFAATGRAVAAGPPVELVETRTVESVLGNTALPEALETWLEIIGSAERSLDFEEFYLSTWPGQPTQDLLAALGPPLNGDVRVRLIPYPRSDPAY